MVRHNNNPDGVNTYLADRHDLDTYKQADRDLAKLQVPVLLHAGNPHERLYIAGLDGTGNSMFKDASENWSVVAKIYTQVRALEDKGVANIRGGYVEGTFTQDHLFPRTVDGVTGFTFERRVETAYKQFIEQAKKWVDEDSNVKIRIAGVGFSRGSEELAALTRMIDKRGIQNPVGATYILRDGLVTDVEYTKPPLVPPGKTMQFVLLYDPVSTGVKEEDRRLSSSVMGGLQITAEDERRDQFKTSDTIEPGFSEDHRFVNLAVGSSHSGIGDTYRQNGLGIRNFNLGVDVLNALSDRPFLAKRAIPEDPALSVVHRSEQHLLGIYTTRGFRDGIRDHDSELAPSVVCKLDPMQDCRNKEPIDPVLDAQVERRGVPIGVIPPAPAAFDPDRDIPGTERPPPGARKEVFDPKSAVESLFERLSQGAVDRDDAAMRSATRDYLASPASQQFRQDVGQYTQRIGAQERQLDLDSRQQLLAQQQAQDMHKGLAVRM